MSLLDDVKARLDIADVVSSYVPLAQAGGNLRARCPFHTEKTPSFYVFPDRQTWRCFGACAEGGDAISFVMKTENMAFRDALHLLARRLGVPLASPHDQQRLTPLHRANDAAARYYHQTLLEAPEGVQALAYLEERGVTRETVDAFQLGVSPLGWEGLKGHLLGQGFTEETLVEAGLLTRSQEGSTRDLFRGRLMFPIRDATGRPLGFGGRALDGGEPKYMNTPRTPLFDKRSVLYALDAAHETIRTEGVVVVVEGYMDALMAHQYGFRNVVASMGTALTTPQVAGLTALAGHFVLALDPDAAGQEATLRSLEASWRVFQPPPSTGGAGGAQRRAAQLQVALLPDGRDPDALIRQDPERWRACIAEASELLDFLFRALPPRYDLATSEGKLALAERFGGLLLSLDDPARQDSYLEQLEGLLGMSRHNLGEVLGLTRRALLARGEPRRGRQPEVQGYAAAFTRASHDPLEEYTLALLIQHPSLQADATSLTADYFQRSENRELFLKWTECAIIGAWEYALEPSVAEHLASLVRRTLPPMDLRERTEALAHCLRRLEERQLRELTAQYGVLLAQVQGEPEEIEALELLRGRNERLREIHAARVRKD